jgi:dTDP-L-rhamnose 4-epimerase
MLLRIANFTENGVADTTAPDTVGAHERCCVPDRARTPEVPGMKVLVTGGSGFIGSHVVDLLVSEGHDVVTVDRVVPSHPNPAAEFVQADLVDTNDWAHVLEGIGAVSHQAARVGLGLQFDDVTDYAHDNDLATAVLLRELARSGFDGRLVLASSMVVYGEGSYRCPTCGPVRPGPRAASRLEAGDFEPPCPSCGSDLAWVTVDEEAPFDPRNIYAATKVHQEHLCSTFGRETGVPVIALRYHNVYGPRAPIDTPYAGVASLFLAALHRGEAPRVFEDGRQTRDFVHVADVARANVASLCAGVGVTGAFNVASGTPRSIADVARELWTVVGSGGPPPVVTGEWRLGDVRHIVASPAKAAAHLGFQAAVPFREGLSEVARELVHRPS